MYLSLKGDISVFIPVLQILLVAGALGVIGALIYLQVKGKGQFLTAAAGILLVILIAWVVFYSGVFTNPSGESDSGTAQTSVPSPGASSRGDFAIDDMQAYYENLEERKKDTYTEYGFRQIRGDSFLVELEKGYGYAGGVDQIRLSEIALLNEGYNIWTSFGYEFDEIPQSEMDSLAVQLVLYRPDGALHIRDDGALATGRVEYETSVLTAYLTDLFAQSSQWPLGEYRLCLFFDQKLAGESCFQIVDEEENRKIYVKPYELSVMQGSRTWDMHPVIASLYETPGGKPLQLLRPDTYVDILSMPIPQGEQNLWLQAAYDGIEGYVKALELP